MPSNFHQIATQMTSQFLKRPGRDPDVLDSKVAICRCGNAKCHFCIKSMQKWHFALLEESTQDIPEWPKVGLMTPHVSGSAKPRALASRGVSRRGSRACFGMCESHTATCNSFIPWSTSVSRTIWRTSLTIANHAKPTKHMRNTCASAPDSAPNASTMLAPSIRHME